MSMTLRFYAWNTQHSPSDYHFTVEPEDLEMGRQIGVLTPREIIPSDRVADWIQTDGSNEMDDALYEQMAEISWASRVSGKKPKTPQELCDQEIAALEFLLLQAEREGDDIEEMMDTLSLHWEEDMDRIVLDVSAPFVCDIKVVSTNFYILMPFWQPERHYRHENVFSARKSMHVVWVAKRLKIQI